MKMKALLLALGAASALVPAQALAGGVKLTPLPAAMPKAEGMAVPSALSPELIQIPAAQGAIPLENPTALLSHYGFAADGPMVPAANAVQGKDNNVEATKTEPDKNTYLVLDGQNGPDAGYDYGTHFLFQGHEVGPKTADGKPHAAHAHQPRCRLRAPRHADGRHRQRRQPAAPGRRLHLGSLRQAPPSDRRGRRQGRRLAGDRRLPVEGRQSLPASPARAATKASRSTRRQRLDRRGRRRQGRRQRQARQAAEQLRLPLHAEGQDRPRQGRQARGPADHGRLGPADRLP